VFDRFWKLVATAKEKAMGDAKMTPAELADEKKRKAGLAAEIERMDDTELKLLAARVGVDPATTPERKDLVAAIELKAEADAAAGRQAIRDMDEQERTAVSDEDSKRPATARIIRALNAEFCRDIPQEGRHGSFEPDEDHPRFGGDYDVPNGKYRVSGSEWLILIHKKKLQGIERATEKNNYGGRHVIAVD
jgi:hypothetical protein